MNRKQKRAKKFRRAHHQKVTSQGTRRITFPDGTEIDVERGPKPMPGYRRVKKTTPSPGDDLNG